MRWTSLVEHPGPVDGSQSPTHRAGPGREAAILSGPPATAVTITGLIGFDVETGSWIVRPELPQTP